MLASWARGSYTPAVSSKAQYLARRRTVVVSPGRRTHPDGRSAHRRSKDVGRKEVGSRERRDGSLFADRGRSTKSDDEGAGRDETV